MDEQDMGTEIKTRMADVSGLRAGGRPWPLCFSLGGRRPERRHVRGRLVTLWAAVSGETTSATFVQQNILGGVDPRPEELARC